VGQICATASIKGNLEQCVRLVGKAAAGGAKVGTFAMLVMLKSGSRSKFDVEIWDKSQERQGPVGWGMISSLV
jgi:hypothetical protein